MATPKAQSVAQNHCNNLTRDHVSEVNPNVSGEFVAVATREVLAGKVPEAAADAKAYKVGTATRWYVSARFKTPGLAFDSIALAAAKCKHKVATGSKGGKVPESMLAESKRLLSIRMKSMKYSVAQLEADAAFLISAAPKTEGKTLSTCRLSIEGVGAFYFKDSAKQSDVAQENRAQLAALILHINAALAAVDSDAKLLSLSTEADLKAEADARDAEEKATVAAVAAALAAAVSANPVPESQVA